jgi:hypothetical protein
LVDDGDIQDLALLACLSAFVKEVWPRLNQQTLPPQRFFQVEGKAVFDSITGANLYESSVWPIKKGKNLGPMGWRAKSTERK